MFRRISSVLTLPLVLVIAATAMIAYASSFPSAAMPTATEMVRLPGHVLPVLSKAKRLPSESARSRNEPITLTILLKPDDKAGFDRYLKELYDPHSAYYHEFLTQAQVASRFGPSAHYYHEVISYMEANGFGLVEGSKNRLTVTVRGSRADAEHAFDLHLNEYQVGDQTFCANDTDPGLPKNLAPHVQSIAGLFDYPTPEHTTEQQLTNICAVGAGVSGTVPAIGPFVAAAWAIECALIDLTCFKDGKNICAPPPPKPTPKPTPRPHPHNPKPHRRSKGKNVSNPQLAGSTNVTTPSPSIDGTGQTVGLVEFDAFEQSDVVNFLNLIGFPSSQIDNLSVVQVNGGIAPGPNQDEVLLDIDTVLADAPGANVAVYEAPFAGSGSFQPVFNQMISDGVTIISNSWAYCEDQTTAADVQGIDTIFQHAAISNIGIFNGSGDHGSTCLDGSANTVSVPADSPNATAVGGSSLVVGLGGTYGSETWWNGANNNPPTGQGGFGTSKFFAAPSYQQILTGSSMRMVPDVVSQADPGAVGFTICEASAGGCPTPFAYGGTSYAAPTWAAFEALLNDSQGINLGNLNPLIYPLANTSAFHNAASMGSDFTHVGLGSPNLDALDVALAADTIGTPDATLSGVSYTGDLINGAQVLGVPAAPGDGSTQALVAVELIDADGDTVSGKTVTITANPPGSAQISPASGVSSVNNGAVVFSITDTVPETLTISATDTTDGVALNTTDTVTFVTPVATSAGLNVFPTSVTADGLASTDITVTMKDSLGRPSPGKLIQINQSGGNSVISGPNPSVTNSNGIIEFTATDQDDETVTYSAVDVTDGNIPFPTTGQVSFNDSPASGCATATPPAAPGFLVTPYATGFFAQSYSFGDVNFTCAGAYGMAFDSSGNLYVSDSPTGDIYKFPPGGGVAGSSTLLTTTALGQSLASLVFDASGNLYGSLDTTAAGFTTGMVLQIDPATGADLRTVASNLTCPSALSIDPLSGDLFADDSCFNSGSNDAALWRISSPASDNPPVSIYATLPSTPNSTIAFAPSGTMYVWGPGTVAQVSGTNGPATPTVANVPGVAVSQLGLLALGTQSNGDAQTLIANFPAVGATPALLGTYDLTTTPASPSVTLVNNVGFGNLIFGPDGCVYAAQNNAVYRITDTSGGCSYTNSTPAPVLALSPSLVTPNPAQGGSQTLTASFHYVTVPTGTSVTFHVAGANSVIGNANTNASGQASFTYTAMHQGVDTITAAAALASTTLTSNQAVVTWGTGKDVTFVSLNSSPTTGTPSQSVNLVASLTDVSSSPAAPLAGQSISLSLGGSSCGGTTNASGIATCAAGAGSAGIKTLSASFAGTSQYVASSASTGFNVVAAATTIPSPTATPTPVPGKLRVAPKRLNFGTVDVGSSKVKSVKITNLGKITKKKHPVPILIESESGAASPFTISQACDDDDLGPRSKGVKPGTCEVSVTFTPTEATKYEGTLMIKDNLEPGFGQSVALKGAGKTPK